MDKPSYETRRFRTYVTLWNRFCEIGSLMRAAPERSAKRAAYQRQYVDVLAQIREKQAAFDREQSGEDEDDDTV